MDIILQIGDRDILDRDLHLLLTQYQLLPQLAKELTGAKRSPLLSVDNPSFKKVSVGAI